MSEFRQDVTTGAWVLIAPERSRRPSDWRSEYPPLQGVPAFDPSCPFCPGNERLLPGIVSEVAATAAPGWQLRVVPNKYPVVQREAEHAPERKNSVTIAGYGSHRIIIETPRHNEDFDAMADAAAVSVMNAYQAQFAEISQQPGIRSVILFHNRGAGAGASLQHPHAQIIGLGMVPPRSAASETRARAHFARAKTCVTCAYIASELQDQRRVVEVTPHFVLLVPYAAESPFALHILPRHHQPAFGLAQASELSELAMLLRRALRRLKVVVGDAPYNWVFDAALASEETSSYQHWRLRLLPKLTVPGGFETGAGLRINPSQPEEDAQILRQAFSDADAPRP